LQAACCASSLGAIIGAIECGYWVGNCAARAKEAWCFSSCGCSCRWVLSNRRLWDLKLDRCSRSLWDLERTRRIFSYLQGPAFAALRDLMGARDFLHIGGGMGSLLADTMIAVLVNLDLHMRLLNHFAASYFQSFADASYIPEERKCQKQVSHHDVLVLIEHVRWECAKGRG
jgi:hypothetical protein